MLNKELQKAIYIQTKKEENPLAKSETTYFAPKIIHNPLQYKEVPYSLKEFVKKNNKTIILKSACKKIRGLKYEVVLWLICKRRKKSKIYPFKDIDYIKPLGKFCDVLVEWSTFVESLYDLGFEKKEISKIFSKNAPCFFSLKDYEQFIKKRTMEFLKKRQSQDVFFDDISIDDKMYYRKCSFTFNEDFSDRIKCYIKSNKENPTKAETVMKEILELNGFIYEFQKPCCVEGKTYIMDFFLPEYGICLEVDGCYHDDKEQLIKDRERTNKLSKHGILLVRYSNEEVFGREKVKIFLDRIRFNLKLC